MAENLPTPSVPGKPRRALATSRFVPQEMLGRQGYAEGDFWLGRTLKGRPFGWHEDMNLMTCAGPRAGKGIGVIVPNLLLYPGSTVVIDPKGELASLTAKYRRDQLGQKVIVLDPAGTADVPPEMRGTYNPLGQIDPTSAFAVADAQSIASGIVVPNPHAKEPFWDQTALSFIQAVILYMTVFYAPEDRTLMKLRETASVGDWKLYEEFLQHMREGPDGDPEFETDPSKAFEILLGEMFNCGEFGGVLREEAAKISGMGDSTRGNVLGGVRTHLDFLKEPLLADCLSHNPNPETTFELPELRRQDRHLTVYLCLPVDMMGQQGRWLRLIINQMVQYIERTGRHFDKKKDLPVMMMVDEFAQLGPVPTIPKTLTYAPGLGLRLWLIIQDLNQLKANYPNEWESILGACGIQQFFGVNDPTTSKYISDLLGEEEVEVPSMTMTENRSETDGWNRSQTDGVSSSETDGQNWSNSRSTSASRTEGTSTSNTRSTNSSTSIGHNEGWNTGGSSSQGWNKGTSFSKNDSHRGDPASRSNPGNVSYNAGQSAGVSGGSSSSSGRSGGVNVSRQHGTGYSTSESHSASSTWGSSESSSEGGSRSTTRGRNQSETAGQSGSETAGRTFGFNVSRQTRKLYRPEEVRLAFTKDNLVQLTYVRDQGGMLLFRTPFFADPYFQKLLSDASLDDE